MSVQWRTVRPPWGEWLGPSPRASLLVAILAIFFLLAHVPFVAPGAGSIDAMNFALAVQDFDISDHRPHPPGYPVFVALGKLTHALVTSAPGGADTVRHEAQALAIWSALFGALAVFPLFIMFRSLDPDDRRAAAATALTITCPLFWFLAIRPMSDLPGLGAALLVQAFLFSAYRCQQQQEWSKAIRLLLVGALFSGLAVGLRTQTVWLTLPLLTVVSLRQVLASPRRWAPSAALANAFVFGVALWAVPLVAASGGPESYQAALALQAGEDLTDVRMLFQDPSIARLMTGLVSTFAHPWANKFLAAAVLGLAAVGVGAMLIRSRSVLGWLALAAGPYVLFHLLFQDPNFTRYALPATPFIAYAAVCGLDLIGRRRLVWSVAALSIGCLAVGGVPVVTYATSGSAAFQAIAAVRKTLFTEGHRRPVIAAHHEVDRAIRGENLPVTHLASPRRHEWIEAIDYWRKGGLAPLWFLADAARTDLALIDPSAQTLRGAFRLPFDNRFLMGGARPAAVNWFEVQPPGWMLGRGWAMTPETAGVAWREMQGPAYSPISAWVRRRPEATVMYIGGRNLGDNGQPDVRFDAAIDGRPLASWVVGAVPGFFLKTFELPAGALAGDGSYAEVTIAARSADGVIRQVNAAIEQFNIQSVDRPLYGFDTGWYQLEYDTAAKRLWRWTGPWARLRVHHAQRDLTLRLVGDSPLKYLDGAPTITVRAGDQLLGRLVPASDFEWHVAVPADALTRAAGILTVETDSTFVPDERVHNGDRRPLGLRIFEASLVASAPRN